MPARTTRSPLLSITLDRHGAASLQEQLYDRIREAILNGRLKPGSRLPASRVLASELGVSRNTILGGFERLHSEGYIEGHMGAATQVSMVLPEDLLSARNRAAVHSHDTIPAGKISNLSERMGGFASHRADNSGRAFRPSLPDLREFPFQLWSRTIAKFWRNPPPDLLTSGDYAGYPPLRRSIAGYLGAVRGLNCTPEQIIITSGAQQALDLIARTVVDPGNDVWVENPGYDGLSSTLVAAGATLHHIPVDEQGLSVKYGCKVAPDAVLAAVTPSHQYPLGITMSLARRLELLDWATRQRAWILEDDYDSEFRYGGKPLSALQGLDKTAQVIYVGTFSKVLFPALRLGYMVVPDALIEPVLRLRRAIDDYPALALQPALHSFIDGGQFAAHIRRLRGLYARRQSVLVEALQNSSHGLLSAQPSEAGMHLIASLAPELGLSDVEASIRAARVGLVAQPLSGFYGAGGVKTEGLVLGYAGLNEREIEQNVKLLLTAMLAKN